MEKKEKIDVYTDYSMLSYMLGGMSMLIISQSDKMWIDILVTAIFSFVAIILLPIFQENTIKKKATK